MRRVAWSVLFVGLLSIAKSATAQPSYNIAWTFHQDGTNGALPIAPPIQGSDGKLYGTTSIGPSQSSGGSLFSFDPATKMFTTLHEFPSPTGNGGPLQLIQALDGKIYGTTSNGGANQNGTIFSIDPAVGGASFEVLYNFPAPAPGSDLGGEPLSGLIQDSNGIFYGTTAIGGAFQGNIFGSAGTVYAFDATTRIATTIHSFGGGVDSLHPGSRLGGVGPFGRVLLVSGKLYGSTESGGAVDEGVAFSLDPATRAFTLIHDFGTTGVDGATPLAGFVQGADGKVYGTTIQGGLVNGNTGGGTVFSIDPASNAFAIVFTFAPDSVSGSPQGVTTEMVRGVDGQLYGITSDCGFNTCSHSKGMAFALDPANNFAFTPLHSLAGPPSDGNANCTCGGLMQAADGSLYGVTFTGGTFDQGVMFRVVLAKPTVRLTVNGQHPSPPIVHTTGPMTLTLDITASTYSASVSWYWALIVNNQAFWITSTGVKTTPAPLAVAPPVALTGATLLNLNLPAGTTIASVFLLLDASNAVLTADAVEATRP